MQQRLLKCFSYRVAATITSIIISYLYFGTWVASPLFLILFFWKLFFYYIWEIFWEQFSRKQELPHNV